MARRFDKLDLALLHVFVTVCDAGSLQRGAALLGLSRAGVTLQMDRLEAVCGRPLFLRHAGGPRMGTDLTSAGQRFLPKVRAVLELADEARAALGAVDNEERD